MRYEDPPLEARLIKRYKRFLTDVELDGETLTVHCPNTGSLEGCKEPGSRVWIRDSKDEKRKLRYTWQAIRVGRSWVNVDTGVPNRVAFEAAVARKIPELPREGEVRREVRYGENSRIDLLLTEPDGRKTFVEVKSTTLARGRVGLFPDAVTSRGLKHLKELQQVVREGHRAVQFFFVSRPDVDVFSPAEDIDPEYTRELRRAAERGVEILAWTARVRPREVVLDRPIEVDLVGTAV